MKIVETDGRKAIRVFDERREEWRSFLVEKTYTPHCGNSLHQLAPGAKHCACAKIQAVPEWTS